MILNIQKHKKTALLHEMAIFGFGFKLACLGGGSYE